MFRSKPLISQPKTLDESAPVVAHIDANAGFWPAVPAPEGPAKLTEIDSRSIAGHSVEVALYFSVGSAEQHYVVHVEGTDGRALARIRTDSRADALDAFRHPFARPDVPDIFGEAA
jgi:hypothetical protein